MSRDISVSSLALISMMVMRDLKLEIAVDDVEGPPLEIEGKFVLILKLSVFIQQKNDLMLLNEHDIRCIHIM